MRTQMKEERMEKEHAAGGVICTTGRCENIKCHQGMVISKCPSELGQDDEMRENRSKAG